MNTPTLVLAAFSPDTELELTLEGTLVLEALDCAFITGSRPPRLRDTLLALLAMTDLPALKTARRKGTVDDLLEAAGRQRAPRELIARIPEIAEAVRLASEPAGAAEARGEDADAAEPYEKKSSPAAAGG